MCDSISISIKKSGSITYAVKNEFVEKKKKAAQKINKKPNYNLFLILKHEMPKKNTTPASEVKAAAPPAYFEPKKKKRLLFHCGQTGLRPWLHLSLFAFYFFFMVFGAIQLIPF